MRQLLAKQQVRFLVAGCVNTGLDFVMLNLLTLALGLPDLVANTISVTIGICISYALNHFFVFRYPHRIRLMKFLEFFAITGFSSLVLQNLIIVGFESLFDTTFGNSLLLFAGEDQRPFIALNIAKATAVLVGLVWNFLLYKFVVFRAPSPATRPAGEPAVDVDRSASDSSQAVVE
ncbi:MAG: GtrA family protein [Protaetiibacter sp.]